MVIGALATNVSAKMFQKNIAQNYYIRKKNRRELSKESDQIGKNTYLKPENMFERIKISTCVIFMDSFLCSILSPFQNLKCCLRTPCFRRSMILEKCEERFQQELDVNTLIKRMRFSYNSLSKMKNQQIDKYLRLNESSVVMNSESSDDDNFDFQVDKGYFSSTDEDQPNKEKQEAEDNIQDAFLLQLQDGIEKNLIRGMKISKEQRMQLQE